MIFVAIVVGLLLLYLVLAYNNFIRVRNKVRESLAAIDVFLQNRFDALTKIAETVVSYAEHERGTLEQIVALRTRLDGPISDEDKVNTYNELDQLTGRLHVQVENYPDLKASENYMHLQRTINDLEEKISASRRTYNANVTHFNTLIESIPTNIFARMFGFQKKPLLEIEQAKKEDVNMRRLLGR